MATLEQVRTDDSLLRKLDIEGTKYSISAESLKSVEIDLVADPFSLARRASQMEANLSGDDRLILAAKPSELARRLKSIPGVGSIRLWGFPFQTLSEQLSLGKSARHRDALEFEPFAMRPGLWKGRTRHFQGRHEDALGDNLDRKAKDNKKTSDGYLSRSVRPTGQRNRRIEFRRQTPRRHDIEVRRCLLGRPDVVRRRQVRRGAKLVEPP